MSEPQAEPAPEPTVAERLAEFLAGALTEAGVNGESVDGKDLQPVAEAVLRNFFRVDVEANSIYAMPGVDRETLMPFGMVHWGPMAGRVNPDELRAIGGAFIEIAEAADLDSIMVRWLLRDPNADKQGAIRVLAAFREFRTEIQAEV